MQTSIHELLISRDNLKQTRWETRPLQPAGSGGLTCQIDSFALTANNISYADHGDTLKYWDFFAAPDGQGILPVWGFATVLNSETENVQSGERLFGFWPLATHLTMAAARVSPGVVEDVTPHRTLLPKVYNQYVRCSVDPLYSPAHEAQQALFKPLFTTAFVADDFLADAEFFGAGQVVISSASSKTAMAVAQLLKLRPEVSCIGLTSSANIRFTSSLGCYDAVLSYDQLSDLNPATATVYVDIAGNGSLRDQIHQIYDQRLTHSCSIGGAHWQARVNTPPAHGPKPVFLFAPSHVEKRVKEWGPAIFQQRLAEAWRLFLPAASRWVTVTERVGRDAIAATYLDLLEGRNNPQQGYMAQWQ